MDIDKAIAACERIRSEEPLDNSDQDALGAVLGHLTQLRGVLEREWLLNHEERCDWEDPYHLTGSPCVYPRPGALAGVCPPQLA